MPRRRLTGCDLNRPQQDIEQHETGLVVPTRPPHSSHPRLDLPALQVPSRLERRGKAPLALAAIGGRE